MYLFIQVKPFIPKPDRSRLEKTFFEVATRKKIYPTAGSLQKMWIPGVFQYIL